jgi:tRNA pseudouridine13 synthase
MTDPVRGLPRAWGDVAGTGRLRSSAEDFQVDEDLGVEASGEGEHVLLHIRKRLLNTAEVATHIARLAGVRARDVSYAGLKDRLAVTTQTFSVHLPGKEAPDWRALEGDNLQVLKAVRHHRKLRRGTLKGNVFTLMIREYSGDNVLMEERLQQLAEFGIPNYFGSQRFGREGRNLQNAQSLFAGEIRKVKRENRSMWLSAARSWLFNKVLAVRVENNNWNQILAGDVMQLAGGRGQFMADLDDAETVGRMQQQELHVTGPLCGKPGRSLQPLEEVAELEQQVLKDDEPWINGLQRFGVEQDRRALRATVRNLQWQFDKDVLALRFGLASGSYATMVVRELLDADCLS